MRTNQLETILANYVETDQGCWIWLGGLTKFGYGNVRYNHKQHYAHKLFYETLVGPVPEGKELDHTCEIKCCVNPEHLEPVTHIENSERAGVFVRKITHPDIEAIRRSTESATLTAKKYGITKGYVRMLRMGIRA